MRVTHRRFTRRDRTEERQLHKEERKECFACGICFAGWKVGVGVAELSQGFTAVNAHHGQGNSCKDI